MSSDDIAHVVGNLNESQMLRQVSKIVSTTDSLANAVERIRPLFVGSENAGFLTIKVLDDRFRSGYLGVGDSPIQVSAPDLPYCSAPLRTSGRTVGEVVASCAGLEFEHRVLDRIVACLGEQLGMLLERSHLREVQITLERHLDELRQELATRKAVQRAQGVLVTQRGVSVAIAERWIAGEAQHSQISLREAAVGVVTRESPSYLKWAAGRARRYRRYYRWGRALSGNRNVDRLSG